MTNILKRGSRRVSAVLAALAITASITGLSVLGTASAASAQPVEVQAAACTTGTGVDGFQYFAWARCYDSQPAPYRFRLIWSCTGESYLRYSDWHIADGSTTSGFCGTGKRVDLARVETTA